MKKKYKSIFLSPHNDDEALFGFYIIMRNKPLVIICTDSYIQQERGEDATREERIKESKKAMKLLGVKVEFWHIPDKDVQRRELIQRMNSYEADTVFAPAIEEGGNPTHNKIGGVADMVFGVEKVKHYMTYGSANYTKTKGSEIIIPTKKEKELKRKALDCYQSQLRTRCKPFFTNKDVCEYESYQ